LPDRLESTAMLARLAGIHLLACRVRAVLSVAHAASARPHNNFTCRSTTEARPRQPALRTPEFRSSRPRVPPLANN
jgi:hypothetical protein